MLTTSEKVVIAFVIGQRIKTLRTDRGMSQQQLCDGIIGQPMLSLIENGRTFPQADTLELIAARLEDELLHRFAQLLSNAYKLTFAEFSELDSGVLYQTLTSYKGRWRQVHRDLSINLCKYYYNMGEFVYTEYVARKAIHYSADEDRRSYGIACFYLGSVLIRSHQLDEAEKWLNTANQEREYYDQALMGRLFHNLSYIYYLKNRLGLSNAYAQLAVEAFSDPATYDYLGWALSHLGVTQSQLGMLDNALESLLKARDIYEKRNFPAAERAKLQVSIADIYESMGNLSVARETLDEILAQAKTAEAGTIGSAYRILTRIHLSKGRRGQAESAVEQALHWGEQDDDKAGNAYSWLLAAAVYTSSAKRIESAMKAFEIAKTSGNLLQQAMAADVLANLDALDDVQASQWKNTALMSYRGLAQKNFHIDQYLVHLPITL
jgi:transcriptional regulator with XRE-family HTH domain